MKEREALKLALEALSKSDDFLFDWHENESDNEADAYATARQLNEKAITAIKEALAQPEQNTVEAVKTVLKGIDQTEIESPDGWWETSDGAEFGAKKLKYVIELLTQPEQEPVAWWNGNSKFATPKAKDWDKRTGGTTAFGCDIPLYTTPPQRTWVGLTDEERGQIYSSWRFNGSNSTNLELCRDIEAKLKEKNT